MYEISISKKTICLFLDYFVLLILILQFNTVWTTDINSYSTFNTVTLFCLAIGVLLSLIFGEITRERLKKIIYITMGSFIFFGFFFVLSSYTRTVSLAYIRMAIKISLIMIYSYGYCAANDFTKIMHRLCNLIIIIASTSLFFWLIISNLNLLNFSGVIYSNWGLNNKPNEIKSFYNFYFSWQTVNFFGTNVIRNIGIFTEAPMFSFVLCCALILELFLHSKSRPIHIVILLLCIFSTFSSTGIIVSLIALITHIIFKKSSYQVKSLKYILVALIATISIMIIYLLFEDKIESGSGQTRIDDFNAGYLAWISNPFFGNGYLNNDSLISHMSSFRLNNTGFSNSIMLVLSYGGLYLILPYAVLICLGIKKAINLYDIKLLVFIMLFVFMLLITNVAFQGIVFLFLIYLSNYKRNDNSDQLVRNYACT